MVQAKFVDGPLHGKTLELVETLRECCCSVTTPLPAVISNGAEPYQMVAVYVLYDNWPVRYIFDRIDKRSAITAGTAQP